MVIINRIGMKLKERHFIRCSNTFSNEDSGANEVFFFIFQQTFQFYTILVFTNSAYHISDSAIIFHLTPYSRLITNNCGTKILKRTPQQPLMFARVLLCPEDRNY